MGQYAVILTISAILLGGVLLYNARASTRDANDELSAYQTDRIAREASQVALRDVIRRLNDRPDEWTNVLTTARDRFGIDTTAYEMEGNIATTYAVNLTEMYLGTPADSTDPDRVRIKANGTFGNWNETTQAVEPTNFIVEAVYERGWVDVNVPGGFRKAIWSNGDIDVGGSAQIIGDIHSNDRLSSSSSSFEVYGSGTYTGSESAQDDRFYGDPPVAERDSIVVPPVAIFPGPWDATEPSDHILDSTNDPVGTLPAGWYGVIDKGTATDPYVLYVNGNLTINGPVRLRGHIRIYVNGALSISDDASLSSALASRPNAHPDSMRAWADAHVPDGVTIGLYASGGVTIGERTFLAAMLYANGTITHPGTSPRMIIGGLISRQPVNVGGNTTVYYKEGANSVYDLNIPRLVPEGIRLVSYREWADRP